MWTVCKRYRCPSGDYIKYKFRKDDEFIGYTVFKSNSLYNHLFDVGEHIYLRGWQRVENRHNVLLAERANDKNEIQ